MPTRLKRISVALDDEAYAKLEELALSSKRPISSMAVVLLETVLFPGGRVVTPKKKPKEDRRGGKREGAGRPRKKQSNTTNSGESSTEQKDSE
ncbi:ribbon-helix-helix domain-containing protein [Leptolyngbya boryana]|nr:hypothetical protein [Leptolyngbya sp. FACHB-238]MBD2397108.1 hypothetical protein [Leptolyngbya sp. FACHB-239]